MFGLYQTFGLNVSQEGRKYLIEAQFLTDGNFQKAFAFQTFYSVYIIYLSIFKLLHLSYLLIFISNYIISLLGYYCFYKLLKECSSPTLSKTWLAIIIINPLVQYWQFNLFSETFFMAISMIYCYILFYSAINYRLPKIIFLSLVLILCRPTGIFTVGVLTGLFITTRTIIPKRTIGRLSIAGFIALFLLIISAVPLHYEGYSREIAMGSVYCGFPTFTFPVLPRGSYTIWDCYQYIYQHHGIGAIIELFLKKIISFFGLTRPYYTPFHNIINALHYVFYGFALFGIYKSWGYKTIETYLIKTLLVIILLNALLIGLVFNEWSERFTVVIFPFVFFFASVGILNLCKNKNLEVAI